MSDLKPGDRVRWWHQKDDVGPYTGYAAVIHEVNGVDISVNVHLGDGDTLRIGGINPHRISVRINPCTAFGETGLTPKADSERIHSAILSMLEDLYKGVANV